MKKFIIATLITTSALSTTNYAAENILNSGATDGGASAGLLTQVDFDNTYKRAATWVNEQTYPPLTPPPPPKGPIYPFLTKPTVPISITNRTYLTQLELTNNPNLKDTKDENGKAKTDKTYQEKIKQNHISTIHDNIANTLTYFPYDAYTNFSDTTQKQIKELKSNDAGTNSSTQNSTAAFASDIIGKDAFVHYADDYSLNKLINGPEYSNHSTLYIDQSWANSQSINFPTDAKTLSLVKQPKTLHDNYLNFSTLFSPTAYSPEQAENARKYILFSAETTKNLAADLNLGTLFPRALSAAQKENFVTAFTHFKNDPSYQKYMMMINNLIAIRSISLNNLEYLISERTPIKGLGKAIGKTDSTSASPLEVEAYQANHRIENPYWYKTIHDDSPATVQRTIAIELAEIEHQNYQAHLDRERILSALIAANLNSNSSASGQLKLAAMGANSSIKCAANIMNGQQCAATPSQ